MAGNNVGVKTRIETRVNEAWDVAYLVVENESHNHSVPPDSETHFKLVVVSDVFVDKRKIQRHQLVYQLLADLMKNPIHALTMHLYTEAEWQEKEANMVPDSPNCKGAGI